ncbi:hypothetical protein [Pectinatus sottacetonis]|nr:hypothetical protein [Pectinatus sottacetonis]
MDIYIIVGTLYTKANNQSFLVHTYPINSEDLTDLPCRITTEI